MEINANTKLEAKEKITGGMYEDLTNLIFTDTDGNVIEDGKDLFNPVRLTNKLTEMAQILFTFTVGGVEKPITKEYLRELDADVYLKVRDEIFGRGAEVFTGKKASGDTPETA